MNGFSKEVRFIRSDAIQHIQELFPIGRLSHSIVIVLKTLAAAILGAFRKAGHEERLLRRSERNAGFPVDEVAETVEDRSRQCVFKRHGGPCLRYKSYARGRSYGAPAVFTAGARGPRT